MKKRASARFFFACRLAWNAAPARLAYLAMQEVRSGLVGDSSATDGIAAASR
jgi:hypothetical protein